MKVKINPATYNELLPKLFNSTKRIVINYGGAGSGKSVSTTQCFLLFALERKTKLLVVRKVGSSLQDSCIAEFCKQADNWNMAYHISGKGGDTRFIVCATGTTILFKGLDDVNKLKSISGIEKILLEEATGDIHKRGEITEDDFDQLNTRVRGDDLKKPQLFIVFNPTTIESWIYRRFFSDNPAESEIFKTTYKDNKFIDTNYKKVLEDYKYTNYNHYRVYTLGEFGYVETGQEIYQNFDASLLGKYPYDPNEPLHISFDENVLPYSALTIYQIKGKSIYAIDEICKRGANLKGVCEEFIKRYSGHRSGLFIYGDASSRKKSAITEKFEDTFFKLTEGYLAEFKPNLRLSMSNPPVVLRINFVNMLFYKSQNRVNTDLNIFIDERCVNLIDDFKYTQTDSEGKKLKQVVREDLASFQKYGHTSDTFEYFLCKAFEREYKAFVDGGKPKPFITQQKVLHSY